MTVWVCILWALTLPLTGRAEVHLLGVSLMLQVWSFDLLKRLGVERWTKCKDSSSNKTPASQLKVYIWTFEAGVTGSHGKIKSPRRNKNQHPKAESVQNKSHSEMKKQNLIFFTVNVTLCKQCFVLCVFIEPDFPFKCVAFSFWSYVS